MRAATFNQLSNDAEFMSYLPGGFYDVAEVGEIGRQTTPGAFDEKKELKPCGLLRVRGASPLPPYRHGARQDIEIYFYQRHGYANIEAARERAYTLLHDKRLTPEGETRGCWQIYHADDVTGADDNALDASMEMSRFEAIILRR
jgi:hypothetical protein